MPCFPNRAALMLAVFTALAGNGLAHAGDKIALVVNADLKPLIQGKLERLVADMRANGLSPVVESWNMTVAGRNTPADLKAWLKQQKMLKGAVLIGDLPVAWYQHANDWNGSATYICDYYFMDFANTWTDANNDGKFDGMGSNNPDAAIWVSRIKAGNMPAFQMTEAELIRRYLDKNHSFRTGALRLNDRCLQWSDSDWKHNDPDSLNLDDAYGTRVTRITEDVAGIRTDHADHASRWGTAYETEHFMCHSSSKNHQPGGTKITARDFTTGQVKRLFWNCWNCSAGKFTDKDCVGNARVFMPTYGLGAVTTSKTGAMYPYSGFYGVLGNGSSHGTAFAGYMAGQGFHLGYSPIRWTHGLILLGDGTLKLGRHQGVLNAGNQPDGNG